MIELELDGNKVSVAAGSMVMHAADAAGVYVPHFCYHKKLTIAANGVQASAGPSQAPLLPSGGGQRAAMALGSNNS